MHARAPVADFIAAHEPPVSARVVAPDPAAAGAYAEAYARHAALGRQLFGGAQA